MNLIVQKYGGTSVENKEKLEMVCKNIKKYLDKKYKLVIIVSAQGKTTDKLLQKAIDYVETPNKRDLDMFITTGENQSASLLSMMLNSKNIPSISLTGEQAGIITNSEFGNAKILTIYKENILKHLRNNKVVIVTGFQGTDKLGNITSLGRGGSDLSATAIASVLNANKCEIYTDIDGIYSADPRIIKNAKLIKNISYDEMLEASSAGAKVLHNRSVNVAKKYSLKLQVKKMHSKNTGSNVKNYIINKKNTNSYNNLEKNEIKFITKNDNISKICIVGNMIMQDKKNISKIFDLANKENIIIYMISFSEISINIVIDKESSESFMQKLHDILIQKN